MFAPLSYSIGILLIKNFKKINFTNFDFLLQQTLA